MGHGDRHKEIKHLEELEWKEGTDKPSKVSEWIRSNAIEQESIRIKNKEACDAFHNGHKAI